ncbi:MAG: amylo-alpha-1,6-glucosidase, partial [Nostoc sp.]
VTLQPGDAVTLEARVGFPNSMLSVLTPKTFAEAVEAEQNRLSQIFGSRQGDRNQFKIQNSKTPTPHSPLPTPIRLRSRQAHSPLSQQLLKASDQFIVYRASIAGPTVIAGYHWF